jgi:RNA polymerase sigma-70 factor (ECF subfamily)
LGRAQRYRLVTTRWSLVLAAGGPAGPQAQKAFGELYELYWYPLYAFILSKRYPASEAEDLTQGFFSYRLLEKNALAALEPSRGRFRSWLFAAVEHYLRNQWKHERAEKRGGDRSRVELESADVSSMLMSGLTPEQIFEKRWALRLLELAWIALGDECARTSNAQLFGRLKGDLTGDAEEPLARIAEDLGKKVGTVRVQHHRLRRRLEKLIDREILHTLSNPDELDDEREFLKSALRRK